MWAHLCKEHPDDLARVEGGPSAKQPRLDSFLKPTGHKLTGSTKTGGHHPKLVKFVCK
ncbi:Hypothetical protein FKW44_002800, partial [Caligus rogercresseyi]